MLKKFLKGLALFLAGVLVIWGGIALWPRPLSYQSANSNRSTGDLPILIAHGGGNREFPDNTLEAFYNAYSVDSRVLMETDVSITADGVVILSHDTTLDRKTNVTGSIADWTYEDLMAQKVDFGYTNPVDNDDHLNGDREKFHDPDGQEVTPLDVEYPDGVTARDDTVFLATTLEELMLCFPDNSINVEIKQTGDLGMKCLKAVLELVAQYDAWDRVTLASFHEEIQDEFQRLIAAGEVPENFMYSPAYDSATEFFVMQLLKVDLFFTEPIAVLQLPTEEYGFDLSTRGLVEAAHAHNIAVQYWTINDPEEMRELIEIGADGIMTDYPHRLQEVYDSYGK